MIRAFIVAIALSGPAFAAPVAGTATLAAAAAKDRIVTQTGAWSCTGSSCTGPTETVTGLAVATCTAIADKAGKVSAFNAGTLAFGEAELARCNRHVGG